MSLALALASCREESKQQATLTPTPAAPAPQTRAVSAARETYKAELERIDQEYRAKLHEIELNAIKEEGDRKRRAILADVEKSRKSLEKTFGPLSDPPADPIPSSVPGLPPGMEPTGNAMKQVK